jgi:UDP-GlcNAc:undecaprenyl-phosphate GlcNAc-1-phosphate transferase
MGSLAIPITVLWIVAITNSVNLIDGLDGLANGVSAISATTMLVIALLVSESQVAIVMAALVGACVGFMPYNINPAKMFMGDTGSHVFGIFWPPCPFRACSSSMPLSPSCVPFLILGLPLFDTAFAFHPPPVAHGQSPMQADRGHIPSPSAGYGSEPEAGGGHAVRPSPPFWASPWC